jgi:hypothetical protein
VSDNYRTEREASYAEKMERHFAKVDASFLQKMHSFPRFVSRQQQAIYLYKWELFRRVLDVHGSVLEFGVFLGSGLFSFASFSAILEPYNYQRRIIGFDTFEGFPDVSDSDRATEHHSSLVTPGGFGTSKSLYEDLRESTELFDENRYLNHIPKIELVKGDIRKSLPAFLERQPHTLVSLLYLDLDLYEPTILALEMLYDRIPRGGIVAFDEVNNEHWPGETKAYLEFFEKRGSRLQKVTFEPIRCFFVKE